MIDLVLEVPRAELDTVAPLVVDVLEAAFELSVPLVADSRVGPNWAELE